MKLFLNYLIGTAIMMCFWGCNDLEEDLIGDVTQETIESTTVIDVSIPIISIGYSLLRNAGTANHGGYYSIQGITSDEMAITGKGADWSSDRELFELHRHTYRADHSFINSAWRQHYMAIDEINSILDYPSLKEEEEVELKALRAYFYGRLLDLFGNVKLITRADPNPPQSSRIEVFEFVEQELLDALAIPAISSNMDWSNSLLAEKGSAFRINRYAALGLLARLYLNAEVYTGIPMYDKAAIAASAIIDSGYYQLCGEGCSTANLGKRSGVSDDPEELMGYSAVFAPNNEDNSEHIFSVDYDERLRPGMNFSQMNLHYSSQLSWDLDQQPWNGYVTLEEFYNSYEENDLRKEANFLVGPQLDFSGSALLDYSSDDKNIELNYTPGINELTPNAFREAGARSKKFCFQLFGRADMSNNFPIIRLGEIYLIRAEANARQSGNWANAETDVNILRARAGVAEYTGTLTKEEFLAERGREMFQENSRRTDLIRFGKYNDAWWEKEASESYRKIFPIPRPQLQADPSLIQNPGY